MTVPLMVLAFLSLFGGLLNLPFHGFHNFTLWIEHTLGELVHEGKFHIDVALISTLIAVAAVAIGYWIYNARRYESFWNQPTAKRPDDPLRGVLGPVFAGMNNKWWVDELYQAVIIGPYTALARFLAEVVDWRFWHDWFHDTVIAGGYGLITRVTAARIDLGGIDKFFNGLGVLVGVVSGWLRRLQTGFIRNYALAVFVGVVVILSYLLLR
jgi:NADH-quinone oxidoreductase subunit L